MRRILFGIIVLLLITIPAEAANRFAFCATTCTWDATNQTMWGTASGGVGVPASVPGVNDVAIFDAATCVAGTTCTITVNYNPTIQQITMGACTASTAGCILDFSANNNSPTISVGFSGTGTGTRTLNMGNGTWTVVGTTGNTWDNTTVTNFTFNANGSTLLFTGNLTTNLNIIWGAGINYNAITFGAAPNRGGWVWTTAVGTLGTLTLTAPNTFFLAQTVTFPATAIATSGGSASSMIFISSNNTSNAATISDTAGTNTLDFVSLRKITFSGGATFNATNSIDLGGNSGVTIMPPSGGGRCIGC